MKVTTLHCCTNPWIWHSMKVIDVPAKDGLRWIRDAITLFREQPMTWISLMLTWFGMWLVAFVFQAVGLSLMNLLGPTFLAGLMLACRDQTLGKPITVMHLFAAFKVNGRPLLMLGAIILLVYALLGLALLAMGISQQPAGTTTLVLDAASMSAMMRDHAGVYALAFALTSTVRAIFWFAVPLLVLRPIPAMPVSHAIRWSFFALVSNIAPMLVFAAAMFGLALLAAIPLGAGLIILAPVFVITNYTSYLRVFSDGEEALSPAEVPRNENSRGDN
jgi:uncharacterized membrane protein